MQIGLVWRYRNMHIIAIQNLAHVHVEADQQQYFKGPILSKLKFPGFFHDNWGLGAM